MYVRVSLAGSFEEGPGGFRILPLELKIRAQEPWGCRGSCFLVGRSQGILGHKNSRGPVLGAL